MRWSRPTTKPKLGPHSLYPEVSEWGGRYDLVNSIHIIIYY